jgi:TonB family protein
MMKTLGLALTLALGSIAFAGCAAPAQSSAAPADPQAASLTFPARTSGADELPEVRRFNRAVQVEHAGQVKAQVRVCVTPDGNVAAAELVESSGVESYDQALISSVERWTYEPYQAPAETRVCQQLEVAYSAG